MLWLTLGVSLSTGAALAGDPTAATAIDGRLYGAAGCRIEKPLAWNAGRITWLGKCASGYAEGLGVLRNTVEGSPTELFLGRVEEGRLRSGVLVTDGGYTAGHWKDGSVADDTADSQTDRNVILDAFEDAAKAADATSRSMARRSNPESSRFYARLASRLREQMD